MVAVFAPYIPNKNIDIQQDVVPKNLLAQELHQDLAFFKFPGKWHVDVEHALSRHSTTIRTDLDKLATTAH